MLKRSFFSATHKFLFNYMQKVQFNLEYCVFYKKLNVQKSECVNHEYIVINVNLHLFHKKQ